MLLAPQTVHDHSGAIHLQLLRGEPLTREQIGFLLQDRDPLPPGLSEQEEFWITQGRDPKAHAQLLARTPELDWCPAREASVLYALRGTLERMAARREGGPVLMWGRPPEEATALSYAKELRQGGNEEALRGRLREILSEPHPMTEFLRLHPWRLLGGETPQPGAPERGWWELAREATPIRHLVAICPRGDHPEIVSALDAYEAALQRARQLAPGLITSDWHEQLRHALRDRQLGEVAQASWALWDALEARFGAPVDETRRWRMDDPAGDVVSATLPFTLPLREPGSAQGEALRAWLITRLPGCWDELLGGLRDDHPTLTQFAWLSRLWCTHLPDAPGSAREESVQRLIGWISQVEE